ncbi:DNA-binding protein [Halobacteriales archaeon SW_5_70_135]|nr:MAG: DNA-binding protein [Halobacteriales archaeon SW_5_70_135]
MKFREEVIVESVLPTLRSMLAERLRERGLTQRAVADAIGVSQSAVSKYVHDEVARSRAVESDDRVRETVDRVADELATGDLDRVGALVELEALLRRLDADLVADLHETAMPELAAVDRPVRVHDPDGEWRERERLRVALRRGLREIEDSAAVADLLPDVGSNLVACPPEARTVADVIGVPGRIVAVKGRARVPADPEFGASGHVAEVLLSAREAGSAASAAVNVRYSEAIVDALTATETETETVTAVAVDPERPLAAAVADALEREPEASVLYHTGADGIEPIVYVLGPDVETVLDRLRRLL